MVEIPSFFNKPDFIGALLPGYIGVILGLAIFFPELNPTQKNTGIQLDFFSAVVFLVAGPALGYTLRQIQVIFFKLIWKLYWKTKDEKAKKDHEDVEKQTFLVKYRMEEIERNYLAISHAKYYFNSSTGLVFLMSGLYFAYIHGISSSEWGSIPLFILTIIFWVGALVQWKWNYRPQTRLLFNMYADEKYRNKGLF